MNYSQSFAFKLYNTVQKLNYYICMIFNSGNVSSTIWWPVSFALQKIRCTFSGGYIDGVWLHVTYYLFFYDTFYSHLIWYILTNDIRFRNKYRFLCERRAGRLWFCGGAAAVEDRVESSTSLSYCLDLVCLCRLIRKLYLH